MSTHATMRHPRPSRRPVPWPLPRRASLALLAGALLLGAPLRALAGPAGPACPGDGVAEVFARVGDAVVTVKTVGRGVAPAGEGGFTTQVGTGSGVLLDGTADVLTAAHVVQTSDSVVVEFPDGIQVSAKVVATDAGADVARLRLDSVPPGHRGVALADSDKVRTGDEVLVVGAPL